MKQSPYVSGALALFTAACIVPKRVELTRDGDPVLDAAGDTSLPDALDAPEGSLDAAADASDASETLDALDALDAHDAPTDTPTDAPTDAGPVPRVGQTVLVTAGMGGALANGPSTFGARSLSADGRYFAFASEATNLAPGDTNAQPDVFVRDLRAGTTTLVSHAAGAARSANGPSTLGGISADGQWVYFSSTATDLAAPSPAGPSLYVWNRALDVSFAVLRSGGGFIELRECIVGQISADGSSVTFATRSSLDARDTNEEFDVYQVDRGDVPPVPRWRSASTTGAPGRSSDNTMCARSFSGGGANASPVDMSRDGRAVLYTSNGVELVPEDHYDGCTDLFLWNGPAATNPARLTPPMGVGVSLNQLGQGTIDATGATVAFENTGRYSAADDNDFYDIYQRTRSGSSPFGAPTLVTASPTGAASDGDSVQPVLSDDGSVLVFITAATNLAAGDDNGKRDVYVRVGAAPLARVSFDEAGGSFTQSIVRVALSGDGTVAAFAPEVAAGTTLSTAIYARRFR